MRKCRWLILCWALIAGLSACTGCGASATIDGELSDKAREAVFQKKVDLKNRQAPRAKTSSPGRNGADKTPAS
jgi:hypothetical protein